MFRDTPMTKLTEDTVANSWLANTTNWLTSWFKLDERTFAEKEFDNLRQYGSLVIETKVGYIILELAKKDGKMRCDVVNEQGKIRSLGSEQAVKRYLKNIEKKVEYIN